MSQKIGIRARVLRISHSGLPWPGLVTTSNALVFVCQRPSWQTGYKTWPSTGSERETRPERAKRGHYVDLDSQEYEHEDIENADEEEGAAWHCENGGCYKVEDAEAIEVDDDEHKGDDADADDETQESATWRCGDDGCHQVVDDDEHKDGDEVIEEDYYDDDYEQEGASD